MKDRQGFKDIVELKGDNDCEDEYQEEVKALGLGWESAVGIGWNVGPLPVLIAFRKALERRAFGSLRS